MTAPQTIAAAERTAPRAARRRERIVLVAILLVGALVRLGYLAERRAAPDFRRPEVDAGFHDDWARCLAFGEERAPEWRGRDHPDPHLATTPYLRPPGFPFLLAAVYRLSGGSHTAAIVAQMLLGLTSVALAWAIARRLGVLPAAIAAAVMATDWVFVYFEGELHAEPLLVATQLGLVLVLLGATERASRPAALAAGVLLGLGALTRPNAIAEIALVVPWLAWVARRRGAPRVGWVQGGLVVAGAALAILPVTARNLRASGELVPITANLGVNLWIGNHAGADGLVVGDIPELGRFHTCYDWAGVVAALERKLGRELTTGEVSSWFTGQALAWIAGNPGAFVTLTFRKAALFFGPAEIGHNKDVASERRHSRVLRWLPLPFSALLLLAAVGTGLFAATTRRLPPERLGRELELVALVLGMLVVYFLSVLPFFAAARYRVPALPWLALLAGLLARWRIASTTARVTAVASGAALVALTWGLAPTTPDVGEEKFLLDRGRALYNAGDYEGARVELDRALAVGHGSAAAHFERGVLAQRMSDGPLARQHYEECLRRDARHRLALFNLGFVLEESGDVRAAIQSFRTAADVDPGFAPAPYQQGRLLAAGGRFERAAEALREAVRRDGDQPLYRRDLARVLLTSSDPAVRDAAEALRLAEGLPEDEPGAWANLETRGMALAGVGRASAAVAALDEALRRARGAGAPASELARLTGVRSAIESGTPLWTTRQ